MRWPHWFEVFITIIFIDIQYYVENSFILANRADFQDYMENKYMNYYV